jgi:hypothetical protein
MRKAHQKDMEKKGAVVGSKVNIKLDKFDVTGAQGVHGFVFEVRREVVSK